MTADPDRPVAAAIDIGSNSIKMTVARADGAGGIEQLDWASEVVRLGQDLDKSGRLDDDRVDLAMQTLRRFEAQAREHGATEVVAVATEATRAAANGEAFLRRIRDETGIMVRVVDGDEEAALTFRGLSIDTDLTGDVVIADIGGASTELIVAKNGAMQTARSLVLGSGRLTDRFVTADPPVHDELMASEAEAATVIAKAAKRLAFPTGDGTRLIVVGGTGEFMTRLVPDERNITSSTVRQVLSTLEMLTAADLAAEIEIPEARARVLPAGVAIVAAIAERVRPDRIEVSRSGIRAGLLLEAFSAPAGADPPPPNHETHRSGSPPERKSRMPKATKPPTPTISEQDFRETMRGLIADRWGVIWKTIPAALDGADSEGVHDVRVASRRLRAAMDIAAPVFPQRWYKRLHRTAKEITGALGEVRDRDVLLEALRADRASAPPTEHPGIDRLMERVERERSAFRVDMERYLEELLAGPVQAEVGRRFGTDPSDRHDSGDPEGSPR